MLAVMAVDANAVNVKAIAFNAVSDTFKHDCFVCGPRDTTSTVCR
jgi:hypothetical protein